MPHPPIRVGVALAGGALALALAACSPEPVPDPAVGLEPVRVLDIAEGDQDQAVEVDVDGGTDGVQVMFRQITIEPGSGTGLHCHHGQLVVVVEEGQLTHYADVYPGGVHVYRAGDSVVEGARYVHEGINEGPENLVLMITYITPEGKPLAETDLTQCEG